MGLDLYIEARIREKKTGQLISSGTDDKFIDDEDRGFFEVCWWSSWDFGDIRAKMIEISNKYAETAYTDSDFIIPVPQSALREIYAYIVNRSYLPDDEYFEVLPCNTEWAERSAYEIMNLTNAVKLHDLLHTLNSIKYDNDTMEYRPECIPDENDRKLFEEDPQAYEWEFRIFNSY